MCAELITLRPSFQHVDRLFSTIRGGECVLFLGAGISIDSGAPDGKKLASELHDEFFTDLPGEYPLEVIVSYIDAEHTRRKLRQWLVNRFAPLTPKGALAAVPKFKWRSIYTVNIDTLLEKAYASTPDRIQELHPVYTDKDRIENLAHNEVPYYKLHGCLSRDSSADGSLVLTQSDFAKAEKSRKRFFDRLTSEMIEFTVFYVGFRHADPDFWRIFADVETSAGGLQELPRSFALRKNFTLPEEIHWSTQRVTLIDAYAGEFFEHIENLTKDGKHFIASGANREKAVSSIIARWPKVAPAVVVDIERSYEVIDERVVRVGPNTEEFFLGAPPNWGLVAAKIEAARDVTDEIVSSVIQDPHLDTGGARLVLLHAEAGSGKTTLLRRIGVDLSLTWARLVLFLKPIGELDFLAIEKLARSSGERIYIVVDEAATSARELSSFLAEAIRAATNITVLAAARTNEWNEIKGDYAFPKTDEFELSTLSRNEIISVLDTLGKHNALGLLTGTDRETQIQAFESRAQKHLLVALREATEGRNFEEIIVNEYDRIPSQNGQRAYLLVAALHRLGIQTRAGVLRRSLGIPFTDLQGEVFDPTEKIIVTQNSINDVDLYYTTRHPLIADIVFDRKIPSERRRLSFYSEILSHFDLGYASDADAYRKLSRSKNRELLHGFQTSDSKRAIMNQLIELDPADAFVHQHAAIMEIDQGNIGEAAKHLKLALKLLPGNTSILDTQGRLAMISASKEKDVILAGRQFEAAEDIFNTNIQRRPNEPFGYRHLAETYVLWSERMEQDDKRLQYIKLGYEALLRGLERCDSVGMLLQFQAKIESDHLGDAEKAREILARALVANPTDLPSRFIAAAIDLKDGDKLAALAVLRQGLQHNALTPVLHFKIAEILVEVLPDEDQQIKSHFEAAILGPQRNYLPRIMYAAYLFSLGEYSRAQDQFSVLDSLQLPTETRSRLHRFEFRHLSELKGGRVNRLSYGFSSIEYDGGASNVFFAYRKLHEATQEHIALGNRVQFRIAFNTRGPLATDVRVCR